MMRVTNTAVNMDTSTLRPSVMPKPRIVPVPKTSSTPAAIRVVMLPSTTAEEAFLKPLRTEAFRLRPLRTSSLKRSKMMTLASTAMPMPSTIPARPESVSWIPGTR